MNTDESGRSGEFSPADAVQLEFFGIPRLRAGVSTVQVAPGELSQVLLQAAGSLPEFGRACVTAEGRLQAGYLACLNGRQFTTDPQVHVAAGDAVVILSADAGG